MFIKKLTLKPRLKHYALLKSLQRGVAQSFANSKGITRRLQASSHQLVLIN